MADDNYGPKPVKDSCNRILAIVSIVIACIAFVLYFLVYWLVCRDPRIWGVVIPGLGCAIAAIVLVCIKKSCNLAIFICALIGIVFSGIAFLWTLGIAMTCNVYYYYYY